MYPDHQLHSFLARRIVRRGSGSGYVGITHSGYVTLEITQHRCPCFAPHICTRQPSGARFGTVGINAGLRSAMCVPGEHIRMLCFLGRDMHVARRHLRLHA